MISMKTIHLRRTVQALACAIGSTALLAPTSGALAGSPVFWERASHVSDSVTDNGNGTWDYGFTVHNDSSFGAPEGFFQEPVIVDWELPFFDDAGFDIGDVTSPFGWAAAIETIGTPNPTTGWGGDANWQDPGDPFYFGDDSPFTTATEVLHWYSKCWVMGGVDPVGIDTANGVACEGEFAHAIFPGLLLGGFGFTAAFDQTAAPYQASWALLEVQTGDPAFPFGGIAGSPNAIGTSGVPEPGTLSLVLFAAVGGFAARRRAKKRGH